MDQASNLTLKNTKILVKMLSPEKPNINNPFNKKVLLFTKVVIDRNNVNSNLSDLSINYPVSDSFPKLQHLQRHADDGI